MYKTPDCKMPRSAVSAIATALLLAGLTAPGAAASIVTSPAEPPMTTQITSSENLEAQPAGLKGWFVSQGLRGIAGGIRNGADDFIRLAGNWLDDGATTALRQNSTRIADVLDDISDIPDLTTRVVKERAYNELSKFLDPGTAQVIADALEGVLFLVI